MARDYYEILGVSKNATVEEIKKSFRKLAHQHHPDKGGGNAEKFKEINEAYQTLGNPEKRRQYDQFGQTFGQGSGGFNYQDFARAQGANPFSQGFSQNNVHFDFGDLNDFGDLFSSFFGGGATRTQARSRAQGNDLEVILEIDFEESVFGADKILDLPKKVVCDHCNGQGAEPGSKIKSCRQCGGQGSINQIQQTFFGRLESRSVCPACRGEGKEFERVCRHCDGSGLVYGSEKIKIKIPAGVSHGQTIKLNGKGESAPRGQGQAGDLYLQIKVRSSREFSREGDDIFSQYHLTLKQAILGDKIMVATVDGPVSLKIPAGTQSHTKFKLGQKGVPHLNRRGRGDHIIEMIVDIPNNLSRRQRKIIEELD